MAPRAALTALMVLGAPSAEAIVKELYTTNAVCRQNNCINPLFPALQDLPKLEGQEWQKHKLENVSSFMNFCKPFVTYDPALPALNQTVKEKVDAIVQDVHAGKPIRDFDLPKYANRFQEAVVFQDRLAAKVYFYHLSGLGVEAWDHTNPAEDSYHPMRPCARSVAQLVCYTYFPQAFAGLKDTSTVGYLRPCRGSCESYIQACNVECCDESVTCVWDGTHEGNTVATTSKKTVDVDGKSVLLQVGYADFEGSSFQCTGTSAKSGSRKLASAIVSILLPWLLAFFHEMQ